jgi:hypothetical protein
MVILTNYTYTQAGKSGAFHSPVSKFTRQEIMPDLFYELSNPTEISFGNSFRDKPFKTKTL